MIWKSRTPWLILSGLWLQSALFRPYLAPRIPLFPFSGLWPAFWAVWLPPLAAVWLMLGLRRAFSQKPWLPWAMCVPPAAYLAADSVIFLTHLTASAQQLDLRLPAAFSVMAAFVLVVIPPATRKTRFKGSWIAVVAAAGLVMSFWGNAYWGLGMGLLLALTALRRRFWPLPRHSTGNPGNNPPSNPPESV